MATPDVELHRGDGNMTRGVSEILEQVETLFREDRAGDAIAVLTAAQEGAPEDVLLNVKLADAYSRQGRLEDAIPLYRRSALQYADQGELAFAVALYKLMVPLGGPPQTEDGRPLLQELVQRYLRFQQNAPQETVEVSSSSLARIRLFRDFSEEELQEVIRGIVPQKINAGTVLFKQGDEGASLFIITKGVVQVTGTAPDGSRIDLARLGPGDFFGEWSFLTRENRRHAWAEAKTDVELLELPWKAVEEITLRHPRVQQMLDTFYRKRRLDTLVAQVFPALTGPERRKIAERLGGVTHYPAGAMIYQEGDPSESMSIIQQGTVEIFTQNLDGVEIPLAALGPGQYFGEGGALSGRPRMASVRARTDVAMYNISREDLVTSLVDRPEILDSLQGVGAVRAGDTLEKLEDSDDFGLGAGLEEETA
jgi:cAMP-dependent protein kinase regulator